MRSELHSRTSSRKRPWRTIQQASLTAFRQQGALTADADLMLQPWFLPNEISLAVRELIPAFHIRKMRYYFEDYGCIRCHRKNVLYGNNGFCDACQQNITYRLMRSLRKRMDALRADIPDDGHIFVDGMTKAQRLIEKNSRNTVSTAGKTDSRTRWSRSRSFSPK